jgi:hypothetical protein
MPYDVPGHTDRTAAEIILIVTVTRAMEIVYDDDADPEDVGYALAFLDDELPDGLADHGGVTL